MDTGDFNSEHEDEVAEALSGGTSVDKPLESATKPDEESPVTKPEDES